MFLVSIPAGSAFDGHDFAVDVKVTVFWTQLKRNSGGQGQRLELLLSRLGRGFITVTLNNPVFVVSVLKVDKSLAQILDGGEVSYPEQIFLSMRTKRSAQPLHSLGP